MSNFYDTQAVPAAQEKNMNIINTLVEAIKKLSRRLQKLEGMPQDVVEIKDTAGDFAIASSWNGRRVLNTNDNTYKIFAEGAWRQIIAY